jgi:hypothetical protein
MNELKETPVSEPNPSNEEQSNIRSAIGDEELAAELMQVEMVNQPSGGAKTCRIARSTLEDNVLNTIDLCEDKAFSV